MRPGLANHLPATPAIESHRVVALADHVEHQHFRTPTILPVAGLVSCLLLFTQMEASVWRLGIPLLVVAAALAVVAAVRHRRTAAAVGRG